MPAYPDPDTRTVLEPGCSRCPALVECRERISWGTGPTDADLVIVGEAPGAGTPEADRWKGGNWTGMAYTARHSGRLIREMMEEVGFGPDRCYYTNAVKCFPADIPASEARGGSSERRSAGRGVSNREPTAEELANCRDHLERELDLVEPAVVIPTGKHATETLLAFDGRSLDGFVDRVLEPIDAEALDPTLLPILHPSYQNVWIPRLGYTREEYLDALAERLEALGVSSARSA